MNKVEMNNIEKTRKKCLFISYRSIYPIVAGDKIVAAKDLSILSRHYDVDCLFLSEIKITEEIINETKKHANKVFYFKANNKFISLFNAVRFFLLGRPLQNGFFYSKKMHLFIKKHLSDYDFVFCSHIRTAQYLIDCKKNINAKRIVDLPDCVTMHLESELNSKSIISRLIYKIEYRRVQKFETNYYLLFDHVFVISEKDRRYLLKMQPLLENKMSLSFNYTRDLGFESVKEIVSSQKNIAFMGKISYRPNLTAISFFVKEVFIKLKKRFPDLIFNIYGGSISKKALSLSKYDGVVFHGFVDNIAYELKTNCVIVAPMMSGSGTQNKILESMFLEKLVITTPIGASGLTNLAGNEIVVCADADEIFEKCVTFLQDSEQRRTIEKAARKYILSNYSFEQSEKQIICVLSCILGE